MADRSPGQDGYSSPLPVAIPAPQLAFPTSRDHELSQIDDRKSRRNTFWTTEIRLLHKLSVDKSQSGISEMEYEIAALLSAKD